MTQRRVFVSYAAEDRAHAERLVGALELDGLDVWWDQRIEPGAVWDQTINASLDRADAVVVLWSKHAIRSDWVRGEAHHAFNRSKLRSISIDGAAVPVPFNVVQFTDLTGWQGSRSDAAYAKVLASLRVMPKQTRSLRAWRTARRTIVAASWLLIPLAVVGLRLTEDLERITLHGPLLRLSSGAVRLTDVAVLPLPPPPQHGDIIELRRSYPELLETLHTRGVREVFFDVTFRRCHDDPAVDRAFADAIDVMTASEMVVALGASVVGGSVAPCPILAESAARWVNVDLLTDQGFSYVTRFVDPLVGVRADTQPRALWHATVQMAAGYRGAEPRFDDGRLDIDGLFVPLSGGLLPLSPVRTPAPDEFLAWPDPGELRGRIVIVGDTENDLVLAMGGRQPGPLVHAGLMQAILDGRVPKDARRSGSAALVVVTGGAAMAATRFSRRRRALMTMLLIGVLLLVVSLLAAKTVLVSIVPAVLAAVIGTLTGSRI